MARFKAYVTYMIDDEIEFEFNGTLEEADNGIYDGSIPLRHELSVINRRGHVLPWDDSNVYEIVENED